MPRASDAARMERRLRAAGFMEDQRGVSEVLGSLLLIAITVLLVGGLAILVLNVKPPDDTLHADLTILATRGPDGSWGTSDEVIRVLHGGGEAIPQEGLAINVDVAGSIFTFSGAGLTGTAFDDGTFTIGETWSTTMQVDSDDAVNVQIIVEMGRRSMLVTDTLVRSGGGCLPDLVAPSVSSWDQNPADVTGATLGSVTVTATLTDDCSGVDTTIDPHLEYRINDGTAPAWTDLGTMTFVTGTTWTSTIPDPTWSFQIGNSLQYRLTMMTDLDGNVGTSDTQNDLIQFTGTDTFVSGTVANEGVVTNFVNMQDDQDAGASATLSETNSVPTDPYYATTASAGGGSGLPTSVTGAPNDAYYVLSAGGEHITAQTISTLGGSGPITQVSMVFEGHYEGTRSNDVVDLRVHAGSGYVLALDDYVPTFGSSGNDVQQSVDITGLRGSWTFTDVQNLELRAEYDRKGAQDAMTVHVDSMWVVVTVAGNTQMDIEMEFPTLPVGATHIVELKYIGSAVENFNVEVWSGSTWNQRGAVLDQVSPSVWVYQLTPGEVVANAGTPLLRIVDADPGSPAGGLNIDYLKVVSG